VFRVGIRVKIQKIQNYKSVKRVLAPKNGDRYTPSDGPKYCSLMILNPGRNLTWEGRGGGRFSGKTVRICQSMKMVFQIT
jgi:hypothetical protein